MNHGFYVLIKRRRGPEEYASQSLPSTDAYALAESLRSSNPGSIVRVEFQDIQRMSDGGHLGCSGNGCPECNFSGGY